MTRSPSNKHPQEAPLSAFRTFAAMQGIAIIAIDPGGVR